MADQEEPPAPEPPLPFNVVKLDRGNLNDIPARMESVAKTIRDGELGDVVAGAAVLILADGSLIPYGWGRTDEFHSIGMFSAAAAWLASRRTVRDS